MRIISDPESKYFSELPGRSYWRTMRKIIILMIRENQPRAVLHPRKDITLRELVVSSHEDGKITDQQKADYLKKCDELYDLWDKHWKSADRKARRLGFDR